MIRFKPIIFVFDGDGTPLMFYCLTIAPQPY